MSDQYFSAAKFNYNPRDEKEAIEQCVMLNRILANEGILDMMGHVSVRNPVSKDTFFQSCRVSPEVVTRADIMEIDFKGNVLSGGSRHAYQETNCHRVIYSARPDVNAIVHCHCDDFMPFVCCDLPMRPVIHEGSIFYEGIRTMERKAGCEGCTIKPEEYDAMLEALGNRRAFFIRNHGAMIVSESTVSLVATSIYLKKNALALYRTIAAGGAPFYMDEESAKNSAAEVLAPGMVERIWGYYLQRVRRNMPDLYW